MKTRYASLLPGILLIMVASCSSQEEPPIETKVQITLDKTTLTLEVGKTQRLTASFSPADAENTAHEWRTSNPQVATVDNTGMVTAVSTGEATITAVAYANKATATCAVTVVDKIILPTSVRFNNTEEYVLMGEAVKIEAVVLPENSNAKTLTWNSSDHAVATVDNDGTVHGISAGTAEITATTSNNKVAKCKVTVGDKTVEIADLNVSVIDDTSVKYSFTVTPRGVDISDIGICWDTEKTPTVESNHSERDYSGTSYAGTLIKLTPNTRYFIRAYAKAGSAVYYSATSEFSTHGSITTDFKVTEIYNDKIVCTTPVIPGVDLKVCYGIAPNPEITDNLATVTRGAETYTITLSNLTVATKYYFRAYNIKGGSVTYFENEGSASTFGDEKHNISIFKVGKYNGKYIAKVTSTLPEGTYMVSVRNKFEFKMGELRGLLNSFSSDSEYQSKNEIYISGGTQTFYTVHYNSNDYAIPVSLYGTIEFSDIELGIKYCHVFRKQY